MLSTFWNISSEFVLKRADILCVLAIHTKQGLFLELGLSSRLIPVCCVRLQSVARGEALGSKKILVSSDLLALTQAVRGGVTKDI